jgi:hypothetical protein
MPDKKIDGQGHPPHPVGTRRVQSPGLGAVAGGDRPAVRDAEAGSPPVLAMLLGHWQIPLDHWTTMCTGASQAGPGPHRPAAGRPGADRPGPHLLRQGPQARAAQRHPSKRADIRAGQAVHGNDGREGLPQARQRRQAPAGGRPVPQSARPRSTPSARQARSAVPPAGWPPRYSRSSPRWFSYSSNGIG